MSRPKKTKEELYTSLDETVRGGAFLVNGKLVDAFGKALSKETVQAHKAQVKAKQDVAAGKVAVVPAAPDEDAVDEESGEVSPDKQGEE